jgi:hypothetical protein
MEQPSDPADSTYPPEQPLPRDALPRQRTTGIVYRLGSRSLNNLTPKLKDLKGQPGLRQPGLSTLEHLRANEEGVAIDLGLLSHPLRAFPDDPRAEGRPGHVSIAPVNESGEVDLPQLLTWVNSRESGFGHPFTQFLLDAILPGKRRGPL